MADPIFEAVKDSDSEGVIALIKSCFDEYEGVLIDLDDLDKDLLSYAADTKANGGEAYVVRDGDEIIGTIAMGPVKESAKKTVKEGVFELKRLYLKSGNRGSGLAPALVRHIESRARACGGHTMELWTDTRFERAHSFYTREGYVQKPEERPLHDISNSIEYLFSKKL